MTPFQQEKGCIISSHTHPPQTPDAPEFFAVRALSRRRCVSLCSIPVLPSATSISPEASPVGDCTNRHRTGRIVAPIPQQMDHRHHQKPATFRHACSKRGNSIDVLMLNTQTKPSTGELMFQRALQLLDLPDPRYTERQVCSLPVVYQTVTVQVPDRGLGKIVNISRDGAGIYSRRVLYPGDFVVLRADPAYADWEPVLLRISHMQLLAGGGFQWGGPWQARLSAVRLDAMLDTCTQSGL
jgi:hypothetical protein